MVERDKRIETKSTDGSVLGTFWFWHVLHRLLVTGKVIFAPFRPELKEKPCAVGGKDSVLCTANYEARKYGLRAAMPSFIALELCPQVVLFEPNFTKYKHYSNIFR